jgi:hypothetical protein
MDRLTKLLKASILKETNTMIKLNEFPSSVLRAMMSAVIFKAEQLKTHVKTIEAYGPDMRRLMAGEIIEYKKEIELLDTAEIQIATALVMVEQQEKSLLN